MQFGERDYRKPIVRYLDATIRCRGGQQYSDWVERLLSKPKDFDQLKIAKQYWRDNYLFNICSSIGNLIDQLSNLRSPGDRVALVASFTESPGKPSPVFHEENIRIGYPLTSGFNLYQDQDIIIPWLMTTSHYQSFWMAGKSNNLDRIASIYGTQGFESDFVGVIWGRDLLFRNGEWVLGDPDVCYDNIDRLISGKKFGSHRWHAEALELLINRYRIFLSRGIKGTLLFCEDEETKDYFYNLGN